MIPGLVGVIAVVAVVVVSIPLIVGGIFVILVVSNRADPDPTGRRPAVVYAYAISFITLFVTLFATFAIVVNLTSLIGSHHAANTAAGSGLGVQILGAAAGSQHPVGDAVARGVVIAGLLALVAGLVYLIHVRSGERATAGVARVDPAGRVRSSYVAAVSFVCVVIIVVSAVAGIYQVFRILGPGVFNAGGSGSRVAAFRTMLPLAYLALAAGALLRIHLGQVPPESRPSFGWPPPGGAPADTATDVSADTAPIAVEVEVLEAGPPPRKRASSRPPAKKSTSRTPPKKT
jgi:hypothetical protein